MSNDSNSSTEQRIVDAAKKVFLEMGFDGARMQHIADEAGINKASLHYYYRSKERLFDKIFADAFMEFLPKIGRIMNSEIDFFDKIKAIAEHYINVLSQNPHLPVFVLYELNRRPEKLLEMLKTTGVEPQQLKLIIDKEVAAGRIIEIDFVSLIVNILSLCIFPFVGKPIIKGFIMQNDSKTFDLFIEERKKNVPDFIINAIKKNSRYEN